jgi:hypothetical protein
VRRLDIRIGPRHEVRYFDPGTREFDPIFKTKRFSLAGKFRESFSITQKDTAESGREGEKRSEDGRLILLPGKPRNHEEGKDLVVRREGPSTAIFKPSQVYTIGYYRDADSGVIQTGYETLFNGLANRDDPVVPTVDPAFDHKEKRETHPPTARIVFGQHPERTRLSRIAERSPEHRGVQVHMDNIWIPSPQFAGYLQHYLRRPDMLAPAKSDFRPGQAQLRSVAIPLG